MFSSSLAFRRAFRISLVAFLLPLAAEVGAQAPGGFVEPADSTTTRTPPTAQEIQGFLPARGPFTFPAPYGTQGIRITNPGDCGGGDCVKHVGYSYWSNINNHEGSDTMLLFLGLDRGAGGPGPSLFAVDKPSGAVSALGPLFASSDPSSWASGEGWYFSFTQPHDLYITRGPRLERMDVVTGQRSTVFDVTSQFGSDKYVWQAHSSADDRVHSATLREDVTYEMLGCVVYDESTDQFSYFPKTGAFDECHVDKSGRWLVILEDDHNRIIDLQAGTERTLLDQDGAVGHHDMGHGYMVGQDNWNSLPNAVRLWDLALDPMPGPVVYHDSDWNALSANHVAHGNAAAGLAPGDQHACGSGATRASAPRANELVCFRLDTSHEVLVVAPTMTDLDASGGGDDYSKNPKANLDVTGEYLIWTSNMSSGRLDAFLVRVPHHLLGAGGGDPGEKPVTWTSVVNATVTGSSIEKTGGCDGCDDAGAVSQEQISSGDGYFEFTASETDKLRLAGLSHGNSGTGYADIDFALRLSAGNAEVRENGVYKADTPFVSGDRLRVAVVGGAVEYSKNGVVFYTSGESPTYPLLVDTALLGLGSTVTDAVLVP